MTPRPTASPTTPATTPPTSSPTSRRTFLAAAVSVPALAVVAPGAAATPASPPSAAQARARRRRRRLTNLDHLRFLLDDVPLLGVPGHTTYRIAEEPTALAPWTYADASGGGFRRLGGGTFDPATGYYSQGAFNADDISRAAVVFLRDWRTTGDRRSREHAYQTLRALTYLQTSSGPNAGRVVLWQQADGTLNPSAEPVELPDPSDSAESYWLARTVWALGEGYVAFRRGNPRFAAFLLDRLHLALGALEAESLSRYGEFVRSDGVDLPAWLIVGGADATSEALLGLVAASKARPWDGRIRRALDRYAEGVAAMGSQLGADSTRAWPFGAILPWTGSLGFWHAWGGAAPEALASAGAVRRRRDWVRVALADAGTFTPLVLATGGPNNAWAPAPAEAQIAYGAHGRLAGALAAYHAAGGPGLRVLAGLAGGWFFGANPSGEAVYDPSTGVTFDGVETDGRINRNSGAESTIHGQLSMMLLDAHHGVAELATSITGYASFDGVRVLNAETARLSAGCTVVRPDTGAWMGEGNLVGGGYVQVPAGEWVEFDVETSTGAWALPVVWRTAADAGGSRWEIMGRPSLGRTLNGGTGPAGLTEVEGSLVPQLLSRALPDGRVTVRCTSEGELRLDGLMLRPLVATAHYTTTDGDAVLYAGSTERDTTVAALVPGFGRAYDAAGDVRGRVAGGRVGVVAGGFSVTR